MAQRIKSSAYSAMLHTLLAHDVPEISVPEAAGLQGKAIFLDSREQAEYAVSFIPGAIWTGYKDFDMAKLSMPDQQQPVVVYCSVGFRSEKISRQLIKAGFTNVSNLYGGIFEWVNQGYGIVNREGPTDKVHAYSRFWGIWLDKGDKVYE